MWAGARDPQAVYTSRGGDAVMDAAAIRAWMEARHDEQELAAKAAGGEEWEVLDGTVLFSAAREEAVADFLGVELGNGAWFPASVEIGHVALWSPRRGLREVAAKRRRLGRHSPVEVWAGHDHLPADDPLHRRLLWLECSWCIEDTSGGEGAAYDCRHGNRRWPCPDIVDDAQAYTDHPDFPEELRLT